MIITDGPIATLLRQVCSAWNRPGKRKSSVCEQQQTSLHHPWDRRRPRRQEVLQPGMFAETTTVGGFTFDREKDIAGEVARLCELLCAKIAEYKEANKALEETP